MYILSLLQFVFIFYYSTQRYCGCLPSLKMFLNASITVSPYLSFKCFIHPYILNTSITISRYLYPLLNCCKSKRSALHISSMWCKITRLQVKSLFKGLCNSSANCFCQLISLLDGLFRVLKHLNQVQVFLIDHISR